ncbi:glycosyltransferase [Longilinea arvoryzae]|uniref:Glycosyltransferase n=1 Tax=Longilinea arvoryzae TaxID=360412 RepID=A0A0S7BLG3_9CHLR|nr:glycosyltransferase [Longilinea arvoryzae]GAP14506.1 glycosyltransferase [Longilinea arvoryzae]
MTKGKIAYVMSRFPHLSETFILREMLEMKHLGWEVSVYPLIRQRQAVVHPQAQAFLARAKDMRLFSARVILANLSEFIHHPSLYLSTAARAIWGNRTSLRFLLRVCVIFPKSVAMARDMRRESIRHVHAHYATHPALAAWIIHHLTGIPYSVTVHAHDIYVEKAMLPCKLKDASFISSISEFNRDYLVDQVDRGLDEKIHIVRCGVLPENYQPDHRVRSSQTFELINIGSLQPYKGQKYLIQACAILQKRGVPVHCRIIGGGELHSELFAQISASNLGECVELLGPRTQEEVAEMLPTADVYIQPSIITSSGKMEGIPVGIMEAMVCTVPVVATLISGVPELVQDHSTGLLVPPEDAAALADAIEKLYREPAFACELAAHGRDRVLQQYNLHTNVQELSSLIEKSML